MCVCVYLSVHVHACVLYDQNDCTTKTLNGFTQSCDADVAAFQEVYDVKHQRRGNNHYIYDMSFSSMGPGIKYIFPSLSLFLSSSF